MSFIECHELRARLGDQEALRGLQLEMPRGEYLALVGPSGCGKTTLLRALAGLVKLKGGSIRIGERTLNDTANGTNVPPYRRGIGMVFQHQALWPHLTAEKTLRFVLRRALGLRWRKLKARIGELLGQVHIEHLAKRLPGTMSGGERQRLSIARAIATEPKVLLLDEPLGPLDAHLRREIAELIHELHQREGLTTLHVTHDQDEAFRLGERIAVVHEGSVQQIGTPAELQAAPQSEFVAAFLEEGRR